MRKLKSVFLLFVLCGGFACTYSSEETGKALINLRLIDAPGDFDEAWIEILGVEIMQSRDRQGQESNWVFIPYDQPNQQVDISKLIGEGVLLIGRTEMPVGSISKIKLILGDDHYLMKDGDQLPLAFKSPDDNSVEITVDYLLEDSFSYDIYLDFDLEQSIQKTSDTTRFLLSPVVRSFLREKTAEIGGNIKPAAAGPVVYAIQGEDTVTTRANIQGAFILRGLKEGEHIMFIQPRKPYLDSMFLVKTEIGKITLLEDITLQLPVE